MFLIRHNGCFPQQAQQQHSLRVGESTYSTARPLYTAKMPLSNILLHSCRVACSSHPTLLEMHINQSACESRRTCFLSVSLFFHLFAVSCMNVLPGDPVKGKAALPRFGVYEGHGWLCHHDRAVVSFCAVPGRIFSLHPCPRHCIRLPIQTTIIFLSFFFFVAGPTAAYLRLLLTRTIVQIQGEIR